MVEADHILGKENGVNVLKYSQEVQTKIESTLPNKRYENTKEGEALPQDLSLPSIPSLFSCNYCEFQNANQYDYDKHTVIRHPNQPGYPDRNGRT
jgi:hypothetical protein